MDFENIEPALKPYKIKIKKLEKENISYENEINDLKNKNKIIENKLKEFDINSKIIKKEIIYKWQWKTRNGTFILFNKEKSDSYNQVSINNELIEGYHKFKRLSKDTGLLENLGTNITKDSVILSTKKILDLSKVRI